MVTSRYAPSMYCHARVRAVMFDFFGTLTQAVQRGIRHAAIARALGLDPREFFAVLDRSFLDRCRGRYGTAEQTLAWVCAQLGAVPAPADIWAACLARVAAVRADTRLRADAVAVLRWVRRRGLRTAVVSDCAHELPAFLPDLPVAPLLDTVVYSVEIGHCKPHPQMYLTACDRLGVAPRECLYIGDGGSGELTGAALVGMRPVQLTPPDIAHHLTFGAERNWAGPSAPSLTAALGLLDP